jgi:hypothetical protein
MINIFQEMSSEYENLGRQIRQAECDLALWQIVCDKVTGNRKTSRDEPVWSNTPSLAVFFIHSEDKSVSDDDDANRVFRMHAREVTIGRSANRESEAALANNQQLQMLNLDEFVHSKCTFISRHQCTVYAAPASIADAAAATSNISTDEFFLVNKGKRMVYVDGKPLATECKTRLYDKSIIEAFEYLNKFNKI